MVNKRGGKQGRDVIVKPGITVSPCHDIIMVECSLIRRPEVGTTLQS